MAAGFPAPGAGGAGDGGAAGVVGGGEAGAGSGAVAGALAATGAGAATVAPGIARDTAAVAPGNVLASSVTPARSMTGGRRAAFRLAGAGVVVWVVWVDAMGGVLTDMGYL